MKKVLSLLLSFIVLCGFPSISFADDVNIEYVTDKLSVVVRGNAGMDYVGRPVTMLLLKGSTQPSSITSIDNILGIDETYVKADGTYEFETGLNGIEFGLDGISDGHLFIRVGDKDITDTIVEAQAEQTICFFADMKTIVDSDGRKAKLTVKAPYNVKDKMFFAVAHYDSSNRLIRIDNQDVNIKDGGDEFSISIVLGEDSAYCKAFCWSKQLKPLGKAITAEKLPQKVLIIGNSFSVDSARYVHQIAESIGADLDVYVCQIGGSTIKTQLRDKDITGGTWMGQHNGFWMSMDERSLSQYLDENEFDAIILQNYWGQSDDIKSYSIAESTVSPSYYPELAEYIKEKQPNTQILINAIWSNEPGGQMSNYVKANYASNGFASPSEFMYDLIEKYNGQAAVDIGKTTLENGKTIGICGAPVKQIPVGYAVEYARKYLVDGEKIFETTHDQNIYNSWQEGTTHNFNDEVEPEGKIRLNRDGYHLSLAGRYLAGCVWVEALTGMDVRNSKYIPDEDTIKAGVIEGDNNTRETVNLKFNGLDNKTATLIQEIAHNAVEKFYMQDVRDLNSPSLLLN